MRPSTSARAGALAVVLAAAAAAQDEPTPDPILPQRIERLEQILGDHSMQHDEEALTRIGELRRALQGELHPSDRKQVLRALQDGLLGERLRIERLEVYRALAATAGDGGDDGARLLLRLLDGRRIPDTDPWVGLREAAILALGGTREPRAADELIDLATRDGDDRVMVVAGQALGEFAAGDERLRKTIVKALVAKLAGIEAVASIPMSQEPGHPQYFDAQNARRTLNAVRSTWNQSLARLTGERLTRGTEWQHWWNKNKSRRWEPPAPDAAPTSRPSGPAGGSGAAGPTSRPSGK